MSSCMYVYVFSCIYNVGCASICHTNIDTVDSACNAACRPHGALYLHCDGSFFLHLLLLCTSAESIERASFMERRTRSHQTGELLSQHHNYWMFRSNNVRKYKLNFFRVQAYYVLTPVHRFNETSLIQCGLEWARSRQNAPIYTQSPTSSTTLYCMTVDCVMMAPRGPSLFPAQIGCYTG